MGIQSILGWKLLQGRDLRENLLIDARQCNASAVHRGNGTSRLFFFQVQRRLHLYTRQRPPRQWLRADGQSRTDAPNPCGWVVTDLRDRF